MGDLRLRQSKVIAQVLLEAIPHRRIAVLHVGVGGLAVEVAEAAEGDAAIRRLLEVLVAVAGVDEGVDHALCQRRGGDHVKATSLHRRDHGVRCGVAGGTNDG